ncbi:MAG: carboxypeptidase-like regulatory domain-containing protein [Actinomycetes bacterium]
MSAQNTVSLLIPDKVSAVLGQSVSIKVGITDFSGQDREVLVRLIGSLTGPLPAVAQKLTAHLTIQVELPLMVPAGMPPGDHPILIEVLDRATGAVLGNGEVFLEVQRTRSVVMHLSPPSIRRRLRGKIRLVLRNHDDQTHYIRLRTESDDQQSKIRLLHQEIELRAGEMVRIKGHLRVSPFLVGKQKEHWYSVIGEGAGAPIYGRGNIRHIPMIGRNIKSVMGLMCIVLVWAGATLAILKQVNPVTKDSTASAAGTTNPENGNGTDTESGGSLELPTLIDVSGTVTAVPDGSGVVIHWRSITIGDVEGSGKVSPSPSTSNPNVANLSTTTDEEGSFSVAGLDASGFYEFTFSKAGHKTKKIIVQPNGEAVTLEVALEVGDGLISGFTINENGDPLGGANITLTDGNITYQTTTPTEGEHIGEFSFANLSTPATWVIDAKIEGRGLASTIINLNAGDQQQGISLSLSPNVTTLEGTVTTTFFDVGSIVTVTATDGIITRTTSTLTKVQSEGNSNLLGRFFLTDLPVGRTYTVTYVSQGYQTLTEEISLTTESSGREVYLKRSTGSLKGFVSGDGLDTTQVAITVQNDELVYKSTNLVTDDGFYLYSNIEPGHYVVIFEALGYDPYISEVDIAADTSIVLPGVLKEKIYTKANYLNLEVIGPTQWTVEIRYRGRDDCGEDNFTSDFGNFTSHLKKTNCVYEIGTDNNSSSSSNIIYGLNPGAYYLVFKADGYSTKVVQTNSQVRKTDATDEPSATSEISSVSLEPLGSLIGQITDSAGTPLEGLKVYLSSVSEPAISDSNGEYRFDYQLDQKTYTLTTDGQNYQPVSRSIIGALGATVNVDFRIQANSLVTGEVRYLNLNSSNYEAVDSKNFAVYYRISPAFGSTTSTTVGPNATVASDWTNTATLGVSKSLGSYRWGFKTTSNEFDLCVVMINETGLDNLPTPTDGSDPKKVFLDSNSKAACDADLEGTPMPSGILADTKPLLTLATNETNVQSVYLSPSSGKLTGTVTVGSLPKSGVIVEARRIDSAGKILETSTTATESGGDFTFNSLTPTALATTDVCTAKPSASKPEQGSCWYVVATEQLLTPVTSALISVYPKTTSQLTSNLNIPIPKGSINLSVTNSFGELISSLPVSLSSGGINESTQTNSSGYVSFSDLDDGVWKLTIDQTNIYSKFERTYTVNQGSVINDPILLEDRYGKVRIFIRDTSSPVAGAQVVEAGTTTNLCTAEDGTTLITTDVNGVCYINTVSTGVHTYVVSKTGLNSATVSVSVIGGKENVANALLGASSGSLLVTLQDVAAQPIAGKTISATDSSGQTKSCITKSISDIPRPALKDIGSCEITELKLGTASVKFEGSANLGAVYGTISIGSGGSALTLTAASTSGTLNFSFFDSSGNKINGAQASITDVLTCTAGSTDNVCEIQNVPEGITTITSSKTGYSNSTLQISVTRGTTIAVRVTLFNESASLKGFIFESPKESCNTASKVGCIPIQNAIVSVGTSSGLSAIAVTDTTGLYRFETLTPGDWTIQAIAYGYARVDPLPISITGTTNADQNIFLSPLPGSIELSLLNPIGAPASDIEVRIARADGSMDERQTTLAIGQAFFSNKTAGSYTVTISDTFNPPRYVPQTFYVKVEHSSTTSFAVYLGTYGSFISIPVTGIPASSFGPATPLDVGVALVTDSGDVVTTAATQSVGSQKIASFTGVSDGQYKIYIVNTFLSKTIVSITKGELVTVYETATPHLLASGDSVTVNGISQGKLNTGVAIVTKITDTSFSIIKNSLNLTVPQDLSNAKVTKLDLANWTSSEHNVTVTNTGTNPSTLTTYVASAANTVSVSNSTSSRTLILDPITLTVKPVDFSVTVTGILYPDIAVTTTSNPTSTTLPLLNNANVTLSDGYLLNSVSSRTNSSGIATFTKIPPGIYTATVTNTSYDDFVTTVTIVDFANPSGNNPRISLNQTATTGRINVSVYGDGDPNNRVSGATVSVLQNNTSCVTGIDGTCILYNLPQGNYDLRVAHPLYIPIETDVNQKIHVTGGLETLVPVGLGSATGKVDFTVFDSTTGVVINNAQVTRQSGNTVKTCSTNVSGKCSIEGLILGSTNFRIQSTNYDNGYVGIDITGGISSKVSIGLMPSLASTNILNVRVIDAITSLAIDGALVTNSVSGATLCTTVAGECVASQIGVGNLAVKAALANYEPAYASVVISPSSQTTLVFVLRPIAAAPPTTGEIIFNFKNYSDSTPLIQTKVEGAGKSCLSSGQSSCTLIGLPLTATTFTVTKSGYGTTYVVATPSGLNTSSVDVYLSATPAASPTTGDLSVRVVNASTGVAITNATVKNGSDTLCDADTPLGLCAKTSQSPGTFNISAEIANFEVGYASVSVIAGQTASVLIALRPISSTLNVIVLSSFSTTSVNGATVKFGETVCANTATSGSYLCSNLSSGVGTLNVSKGDFYSSATAIISIANGSQNYVTVYLVQYGDLTVTTAQQVTQIDVSITGLTQTCSIIGTGTTSTSSTPNSSCQMLKLPYGSWVIKLSSGQSSSVTINSDSKSITIS